MHVTHPPTAHLHTQQGVMAIYFEVKMVIFRPAAVRALFEERADEHNAGSYQHEQDGGEMMGIV